MANQKAMQQKEIQRLADLEKAKKLKLLQKKKKQIEQKKDEDKVLNELFNYDFENDKKEGTKHLANGLGGLLDEDSSNDKPTDEDMEADFLEDQGETEERDTED